jgi:nucleoside-diphosphate-sugar epimerase
MRKPAIVLTAIPHCRMRVVKPHVGQLTLGMGHVNSNVMGTLLITGAAGHSGHWFMKKLAADPDSKSLRIKCVVRPTSEQKRLDELDVKIEKVTGDISNYDFCFQALEGVDTLVHFAGIHNSKILTDAARARGTPWVILVHTTGRYSKFKSAAAEYIETEDAIINSGLNYTILRPTMIYGSQRDRNIWRLIQYLDTHKFFPVFGRGDNLMQPIHAKDVGEAVYYAYKNKTKTLNKAYNIAGREPLSYKKLLTTVSRKLGKNVMFVHVPYTISYLGAKVYNLLNPKAMISVEQVMRMNEDKAFDYSEATKDFGFQPLVFEEGINDEIKEYQSSQQR